MLAYNFVTVKVEEYKKTQPHDSIRAGVAAAITYHDEEYPSSSTDSGSRSDLATPTTTTNAATKTEMIPDSADVAEEEGPAPPWALSSAALRRATNAATKTKVIQDISDVAEEEGPAPPWASSSAAPASSSQWSGYAAAADECGDEDESDSR